MSQRNAGHVVASHPGQLPDSGPVFTVLLTAAFDGVIVTMISFSAWSQGALCSAFFQATGSQEGEVGVHISLAFNSY